MHSPEQILEWAKATVGIEQEAIAGLKQQLGTGFVQAVEYILGSGGRVIITGIGKSAIIGQKITATFNSTGTPSVFMHAADAIHGDLGMIQPGDVVICISKSGNTPEIRALLPLLRQQNHPVIAIVGTTDSYLASHAQVVIPCSVSSEACPHDLAPTSSTTAQLVVGDALAVCLLNARNFTASDFARYHPGGTLGKKLYLTTAELLGPHSRPVVGLKDKLPAVIRQISESRTGATAVLDNNAIAGIITDGDIRRMLESRDSVKEITAGDIMHTSPRTIGSSALASDALLLMKSLKINQLMVCDDGEYKGIVHIQEILREGIF